MIKTQTTYDASTIQTLDALEHIRLRSGMYIGSLGDGSQYEDGIYILLKEIIDNSIDEYRMGYGNTIEIAIRQEEQKEQTLISTQMHHSPEQNAAARIATAANHLAQIPPAQTSCTALHGLISVRDYGRGIPLSKVIDAVSVINTGAKYNNDVFQYTVGLNGVGTKAVNALSSHFLVRSFRDGKMTEATFSKGKIIHSQNQILSPEANGTYIEFWPDSEIFHSFHYSLEYIDHRFFYYSCLNPQLNITLNNRDKITHYSCKNGLVDLLEKENSAATLYPIQHCQMQFSLESEVASLEFTFTHTEDSGENHFSFVNGQFTKDGGVHLQAFRDGLTKGVNDFYKGHYTSQDVRDGLRSVVKVLVKNPIFDSQTKNKLGNTELRTPISAQVRKLVSDLLYRDGSLAEILHVKIRQNTKLRKELSDVRKMIRSSSKRITLNIPQLKDCKYHRGSKQAVKSKKPTMIFLTEGQSATGSLISCRDVYHQALFSLRGKLLNCYGTNFTKIYQNEELFNLLKALGIENTTDALRYDQVILATDADDDGYHIRNLLMTFFLYYFQDLVLGKHLFILETPLFRVRNSKETHYCYNELEKRHWVKKISQAEITRFKVLGEISSTEFKPFIGPEMRLIPVDIEPFDMANIPQILEFYMGKNTPERKKFIMDNLKESI